MNEVIRIAVVDDHPLMREGVTTTLRNAGGFDPVFEGSSGADAVRIAQEMAPDVVLLDINLPGGGIEAARAIVAAHPAIKVAILTISENLDHVTSAMQAGARGYILKDISGSDLVRTVRAIHGGQLYVTPHLAAHLMRNVGAGRAPAGTVAVDPGGLTSREVSILEEVSLGLTNKEVSRRLSLSEKTIKNYMSKIMQKLRVRNRVEAALSWRESSKPSHR